VTRSNARPLVVLLVAVLVGCSASSDDGADGGATGSGPAGSTSAPTTTTTRIDIVEFDGSVEDVLATIPEASRFAGGVADWLIEVPGQEGVLRNRRGVTLFVPVDDGFSSDDRDEAFADADTAAATIGEHLRVGTAGELHGTITMASGAEYQVGDGPTIRDRRVLRSLEATNGVIHLIDGPLVAG
jgi:hypothetical protein